MARPVLTGWLVYGLHFVMHVVRERYPAIALGDHLSFRLVVYVNLHPDLFETEDHAGARVLDPHLHSWSEND